jgi:hypothetical protein
VFCPRACRSRRCGNLVAWSGRAALFGSSNMSDPRGTLRRIVSRLWVPWIAWAYGASFDRQTERHVPAAGLEILESRYVADDLVKLLTLRAH